MPDLKPCLLERKLLTKVWGGRALERVLGVQLPDGAIGESWELFDRNDGSSRLRGTDTTLAELMRTSRDAVLGRARPAPDGRFPLLLKYIDAREALSVQVHPDARQAAAAGDGGKEEAWLVLEAGPRARIISGTRPGTTIAALRAAAATPAIEALLHSITPRAGDCLNLPAGTIHALGPDVVVFEVQTNSDVTYRLYDWGRSRELHVDAALAVARPESGAGRALARPRALAEGIEELVTTPDFRLRRIEPLRRMSLATGGAFVVLNVIGGRGMLGWHSGGEDPPLLLSCGDCVLVPACVEEIYLSPIGTMQVLATDPGER